MRKIKNLNLFEVIMGLQTRIKFLLIILTLLFVIPGCGGGSGSSSGGSVVSSDSGSTEIPLSGSAAVTLSWDAPTTNDDNTQLTDLNGYRVYYGTSSGHYTRSANIGNFTTATVSNLPSGVWYFTVTAINSSGIESIHSNEVSIAL